MLDFGLTFWGAVYRNRIRVSFFMELGNCSYSWWYTNKNCFSNSWSAKIF